MINKTDATFHSKPLDKSKKIWIFQDLFFHPKQGQFLVDSINLNFRIGGGDSKYTLTYVVYEQPPILNSRNSYYF